MSRAKQARVPESDNCGTTMPLLPRGDHHVSFAEASYVCPDGHTAKKKYSPFDKPPRNVRCGRCLKRMTRTGYLSVLSISVTRGGG